MSDRKVALVTGAATGIGRASALRLASQGFDVAINYSRSEHEARETLGAVAEHGVAGELLQCDVSVDDDVQRMIASLEQRFGRLDVLVNNAGTTEFIDHVDLEAMTEAKWDRILAVNVKGPFFVIRASAELLRNNGGGAIVNISSVAGLSGSGSSIAYAASKGALNTMTRSFARSLAPEIRVNGVCPGPVQSRWLRQVMTADEIEALAADWPLRRPATPDDIADAVVYLSCGTSLTTGQLLVVDGGRTMP